MVDKRNLNPKQFCWTLDWGGRENLPQKLKERLEKEMHQLVNLPNKTPTHIVLWDEVLEHK